MLDGLSLISVSGATLHCGVWASYCRGFSCCRTQASVVLAHGLSSCYSRALECRLSSCGTWLNCSTTCRIFEDQGLNPCLLHWQGALVLHFFFFFWSCILKVCTQRLTKTAQLRDIKSRDITLPTKVHLVKAMVFPVVMYGCKSWTVKKAEHRSIDAFELWCWRRLLRVPWTVSRSNQSILKEITPGYSWKD